MTVWQNSFGVAQAPIAAASSFTALQAGEDLQEISALSASFDTQVVDESENLPSDGLPDNAILRLISSRLTSATPVSGYDAYFSLIEESADRADLHLEYAVEPQSYSRNRLPDDFVPFEADDQLTKNSSATDRAIESLVESVFLGSGISALL